MATKTEVEYQKALGNYEAAAGASRENRKSDELRAAKQTAFGNVRAMERELKRDGCTITVTNGRVSIEEGGPTKRSLQEEYIRKFSEEPVEVTMRGGQKRIVDLRTLHRERLMGK